MDVAQAAAQKREADVGAALSGTVAELRAAGVVLFALAAQFMIAIMLAASIAPGYDIREGAISDLGAIGATALLFNGSLLAVGVLNIIGGYLLFRADRRWGQLVLFVIAGIGALGAGLFPLGSGGPHGLFALGAFLAFNLEAIAAASITTGPMRAISLLAGLVGLVFVVLMAFGDAGVGAAFGPIGHGGTERMIVYPPMLWLLAFGGYLMAGRDAATRGDPTGAEAPRGGAVAQ